MTTYPLQAVNSLNVEQVNSIPKRLGYATCYAALLPWSALQTSCRGILQTAIVTIGSPLLLSSRYKGFVKGQWNQLSANAAATLFIAKCLWQLITFRQLAPTETADEGGVADAAAAVVAREDGAANTPDVAAGDTERADADAHAANVASGEGSNTAELSEESDLDAIFSDSGAEAGVGSAGNVYTASDRGPGWDWQPGSSSSSSAGRSPQGEMRSGNRNPMRKPKRILVSPCKLEPVRGPIWPPSLLVRTEAKLLASSTVFSVRK